MSDHRRSTSTGQGQGHSQFDAATQARFDTLMGQAALAHQEQRLGEALARLSEAESLLTQSEVSDPFDWSGYLDLRMCVEADRPDPEAAAATAGRMLALIDPEPDGLPARLQEIIQDSLVEAALVRARFLMANQAAQGHDELVALVDSAIRWCRRLGRDGDEREFTEIRHRLKRRGAAGPET